MTDSIEPDAATKSIRALLTRVGLSERETDAFLKRLRDEFMSGALADEQKIRQFVDNHIAELLKDAQPARKGSIEKLKDGVFQIVFGLFLGVSGNALWEEIFKPAIFEKTSAPPKLIPAEKWTEGEILIEWWIRDRRTVFDDPSLMHTQEIPWRHVLEYRQETYGVLDQRTAFSLDALGMCLDAQGRHREAIRLRSTALKIEEALYGEYDKRTAVMMSNLSVCLASQRRFREAQKYASRSLTILQWAYGTNSVPVACITSNLYEMLKAQGILPADSFAFLITDGQLREAAKGMIHLKTFIVMLDALKELANRMQLILRNHDNLRVR